MHLHVTLAYRPSSVCPTSAKEIKGSKETRFLATRFRETCSQTNIFELTDHFVERTVNSLQLSGIQTVERQH